MRTVLSNASTIRALLAETEQSLGSGPHPERARRDAQALLLHALRKSAPTPSSAWLFAHPDEIAAPGVTARIQPLVERRLAGEPIQYITGVAEFYGLSFEVNRDVLIPRPETEHLVEMAIALAAQLAQPRIIDVGTGSGAIAIALARSLPDAEIFASDLSNAALAVAQANAARHAVAGRIRFLEGDLLTPAESERFGLVISNPPYVSERDRVTLSTEVRDYEPAGALFAGDDGLAIHRRLIPAAFAVLNPGGSLALEIGYGQSDAVQALLVDSGFQNIQFTPDLQSIPRVVSARHP